MNEAVIVSAVRTPVGRGKKDGSLANVHPADLAAAVIKASTDRAGVSGEKVDDVLLGCAMPEGSQGLNVARLARLHPALTESYIGMGFTAERVAERWGVSRADQDQFAVDSHRKGAAAWAAGKFADEIIPIEVEKVTWHGADKEVQKVSFAKDELLRPDTSVGGLAKLRPAFKRTGTVTAGNASPYSDGAAAVLMMSRARAEAEGVKPLARFVTFAVSGVEPDVMGIAPIKAVPKALKRAGLSMQDLDLIEMNEAFAAQALAVARVLEMPMDKLNVNGGAIALGHPLGATGAKLTTHLVHELGRRGGGLGMVTMCVGGGMGAAGIFQGFG